MTDAIEALTRPEGGTATDVLDVALIGAGPTNLSAAAHLAPFSSHSFRLYDKRETFSWHDGLLFEAATLQSSHFKDLIFLSNPSSRYTFFNYLHEHQRLYRYIHADFARPSRREFDAYFNWVAGKLANHIVREAEVVRLEQHSEGFRVSFDKGSQLARNVVIGIGKQPFMAGNAAEYAGHDVFHASAFRHRYNPDTGFSGKRVAVVGGGQSGAEIIHAMISDNNNLPKEILWITRSMKFQMFDETVFCNDIYTPSFATFFFRQSPSLRRTINETYKTSSDGIVDKLLLDIYQKLYNIDTFHGAPLRYKVRVGQTFVKLAPGVNNTWRIDSHFRGIPQSDFCDIVILATGYKNVESPLTESVRKLLATDSDGAFIYDKDFSARLKVASHGKMFFQNASLDRYGWMDPNLGGSSWRAATIVNSIVGREVYRNEDQGTLIDWEGTR
jgi:lysine N6-hydroxylase